MKFFLAMMLSVLLLQCSALQAQGVYVTPGANGPVFSDKPQSGAREVSLPPLNVVAPPQPVATPATAARKNEPPSPEAAFVYRAFSIVQPENDGSVLANTALFEVRVAVDPPLQLGAGHAFAVRIDRRSVGQRFTASEFMIPPEFWGDVVPPSGQSLQLDASIVDREGRELKKADPVRFFMRYAPWVNTRPPRPVPPRPPSLPRPPVPAVGAAVQ
ncbi:MAG: hypothetical protein H6R17_3628 [Proteobacteria bacterium]|nr:hypothetical protein [Pseudomonadota bacterium]